MSDSGATRPMGFSAMRGGIVALALASAVIHIALAIPEMIVPFYLNGLGYVALATAYTLPQLGRYRRQVRWLLIGFTALTIVLWVMLGQPYTTIGYIDKAIELALLGLLWLDGRQAADVEGGPWAVDAPG